MSNHSLTRFRFTISWEISLILCFKDFHINVSFDAYNKNKLKEQCLKENSHDQSWENSNASKKDV